MSIMCTIRRKEPTCCINFHELLGKETISTVWVLGESRPIDPASVENKHLTSLLSRNQKTLNKKNKKYWIPALPRLVSLDNILLVLPLVVSTQLLGSEGEWLPCNCHRYIQPTTISSGFSVSRFSFFAADLRKAPWKLRNLVRKTALNNRNQTKNWRLTEVVETLLVLAKDLNTRPCMVGQNR